MDSKTEELIEGIRSIILNEEDPKVMAEKAMKLLERYGLSRSQMKDFAKRILEKMG
jgi:hypothetical protein